MLYGSYLFAFFSCNKYMPREHKIDEPCNLKFGVLPVPIEDLLLTLKKGKYFAFSFLVLWKHIGSMGMAIRPLKKKNENLCFVKLLCVVVLCSWWSRQWIVLDSTIYNKISYCYYTLINNKKKKKWESTCSKDKI